LKNQRKDNRRKPTSDQVGRKAPLSSTDGLPDPSNLFEGGRTSGNENCPPRRGAKKSLSGTDYCWPPMGPSIHPKGGTAAELLRAEGPQLTEIEVTYILKWREFYSGWEKL
jgi:hypothetical protein